MAENPSIQPPTHNLKIDANGMLSSNTKTLAAQSVQDLLLRRNPFATSHLIFGANTDVGKTVISAGLVRASLVAEKEKEEGEANNSSPTNPQSSVHYIKPLQCGGSDASFVKSHCKPIIGGNDRLLQCQTLFSWDTPASPHVAARKENAPRSDEEVLASLRGALEEINLTSSTPAQSTTTWIETAGGVLSPSSSSLLNNSPRHATATYLGDDDTANKWGWVTQGDLYQSLIRRSHVVLCGDGKLGGISATLSSLESLIIRGYNVVGIVMLETGYDNVSAIREYASRELKLTSDSGGTLFENPMSSIVSLPKLPPEPEPLHEWYESSQVVETLRNFNGFLREQWQRGS